jgi:hypothetical protein
MGDDYSATFWQEGRLSWGYRLRTPEIGGTVYIRKGGVLTRRGAIRELRRLHRSYEGRRNAVELELGEGKG